MKINFPWTTRREEELHKLEGMLANTLTSVGARKEYRASLHRRLIHAEHAPVIEAEAESTPNFNRTIWGITAIVGGILIVLTGFRALAGLLGALGIIVELGRRLKKEKSGSVLSQAA